MIGDGHTMPLHCEAVDVPADREADAPALYCEATKPDTHAQIVAILNTIGEGDIYLQIANDRDQLSRVMAAVRRLFVEIDIAADRCAKARADWHDDPEGDPEGHAAAHAPAAEQYPEADRYRAALSLLDYFATEYRRPELTDKVTR